MKNWRERERERERERKDVWSGQKKKNISNKLAEKPQLVSSQQWNRWNDKIR